MESLNINAGTQRSDRCPLDSLFILEAFVPAHENSVLNDRRLESGFA